MAAREISAILGCFTAAVLLWWGYEITRLPVGVETKGGADEWIPWLSLAGAIVSLATGLASLALALVKLRQTNKDPET
jgi:hypothetical protein